MPHLNRVFRDGDFSIVFKTVCLLAITLWSAILIEAQYDEDNVVGFADPENSREDQKNSTREDQKNSSREDQKNSSREDQKNSSGEDQKNSSKEDQKNPFKGWPFQDPKSLFESSSAQQDSNSKSYESKSASYESISKSYESKSSQHYSDSKYCT